MRVLVFFDLPTETSNQKGEYRRFRKFLSRSGFVMMQESVYTKIVLNNTAAEAVKESVKRNKTFGGLIQMLTVTERQFEKMEFITGTAQTTVINDDSKLILL